MDKIKLSKQEINKLSFEDAIHKLENIVDVIEGGEDRLDNLVDYYTTGTLLKVHCERKLNDAKLKVEKISADKL
jgi:exodeoxyribonuclease VII small subunit